MALRAASVLVLLLASGCDPVRGALFASPGPSSGDAGVGVPPGTPLTLHSGDLVLSLDDATVEGLDVQGCVRVTAARVTFQNSRVTCAAERPAIQGSGAGLVVTAVEVDGRGRADIGISCGDCLITRADIHGANQGVRLGSGGTLEASEIHDLEDESTPPGISNGMFGVQSTDGALIRVRRNRIHPGARAAGAVMMGADLGPLSDVVVEDNFLDDGAFTVYAGSGSTHAASSLEIRNNRFGRGAQRGPKNLSTGATWTGNVWDDTGAAIP